MGESHFLVAHRSGRLLKLEEFESYTKALVAYGAATEHLDAHGDVQEYAVRSWDDPALERPLCMPEVLYNHLAVARALREHVRKEVGATARMMLVSSIDGDSLDALVTKARDSLLARGYKADRWQVEAAFKSRVLLGRCHYHGRQKRGYFALKNEGPLRRLSCPDCGGALRQTTLALSTGFRRLPRRAIREVN